MFKQADERQVKTRETRQDRGSRYAGLRYTHYHCGLFFYTTRAFIHEATCTTEPSWNTSPSLGRQTNAEELCWGHIFQKPWQQWPPTLQGPRKMKEWTWLLGAWVGKQARISAYNAHPQGKVPLVGSPSCFPDLWHKGELRKRLTCSLQENVMVQNTTAEPTKALGMAGSTEGKIDHSCGSKQRGLVMLFRDW